MLKKIRKDSLSEVQDRTCDYGKKKDKELELPSCDIRSTYYSLAVIARIARFNIQKFYMVLKMRLSVQCVLFRL
jgi:hypothetical protein